MVGLHSSLKQSEQRAREVFVKHYNFGIDHAAVIESHARLLHVLASSYNKEIQPVVLGQRRL